MDQIKQNSFAEACYNQNSVNELKAALSQNADQADCSAWNISENEWHQSIKLALNAKLSDLTDKENSMKTITAHFAATKTKYSNLPARTVTFEQDDKGVWYIVNGGTKEVVREYDVIDYCAKALNWKELRAKYFPMHGFHS